MRARLTGVLALLALFAAGCLPIPSLYPFIPKEDAIEVPGIVGIWGDSSQATRFTRSGDALYTMADANSADSSARLRVRFARFGGRLFADAFIENAWLPENISGPWLWRTHILLRVDLAGDSLRLAFLDDDWVKTALEGRRIKARHEQPEDGILLTEKTPGLQAMARKIANVDAAFDTSATYSHRR